jgi:O-antigen/teichoic acid export membrane protein
MSTAKSGGRRLLLSDGFWAATEQGLTRIGSLALALVLARVLVPADVGRYLLLVGLVAVGAGVGQLGLGTIAVREIAARIASGDAPGVQAVVGGVARLGAAGMLLAMLVVVVPAMFVGDHISLALWVAGWAAMLLWQSLLGEVLRGLGDLRGVVLFGSAPAGVVVAGGLWLLRLGGVVIDLTTVAACTVIVRAVGVSFGLPAIRKRLGASGSVIAQAPLEWRLLLSESWPVLITQSLWMLIAHGDVWIIGLLRSPAEAAAYGLAVRTVALLTIPQTVVRSAIIARVARHYASGNHTMLVALLRNGATLAGLSSGVVWLGLIGFGSDLLGTLYGSYYTSGALLLAILGAGELIGIAAGLGPTMLTIAGRQRWVMLITLIRCLVVFGAALALVQLYGAPAVAVAFATGVALANLAATTLARMVLGIPIHMYLLRLPRRSSDPL